MVGRVSRHREKFDVELMGTEQVMADGAHAAAMLAWYDRNRRRLPWRAEPGELADPYRVWLSEIMLQQTTVQAVAGYYSAFLARWPTVGDLARSDLDDVLKAWAGLGYYARARNLHKCAQVVVARHRGRFPDQQDDLLALPGIGDYTAAAIAAIAFDRPAAVMDGNVERVVSRLYAVETPLPAAKPALKSLVTQLTPQQRPGDYAQAMMDLGATLCTPRNPACGLCPVMERCAARRQGNPERYPLKQAKPEKPIRHGLVYWLMRKDGSVLVRRRPEKGLLGGMTEFPGSDWRDQPPALTAAQGSADSPDGAPCRAEWRRLPGQVRHTFTHFHLELTVLAAAVSLGDSRLGRWVPLDQLGGEALPTLYRKVMRHALREGSYAR